MIKKVIYLLFSCVIMSSLLYAQVNVDTYGVSPRFTETDTLDNFDLAYNGLNNVGTNTKVYLKGWSDTTLAAPSWTVLSKPAGSAADVGTAWDMDSASQVTTIFPDLTGTYMIEFADGANSDTVTINAGTYLGVNTGTVSCATCHSAVYEKWQGTGHSDIFKRAMEGTLSDHYAPYCMPCHTTGYDVNADNDGFDDRDFVYPSGPDSLNPGTWDLLLANSPRAMELANIQCESCHGPGSEHMGNVMDSKMVSSLDVSNCALCHDSGPHHGYPNQWEYSGHDATEFDGRGFHGGHAVGAFVGYAGGRGGCAACHSGSGYIQWIKENRPVDDLGLPGAIATVPEPEVITCAVCHDPHDNTVLPNQLRFADTQLGDGTPITGDLYGTGAQCMECHRSRRNAATYAIDPGNASSHYGPHHGPQADMLIGANAPEFGFKLPSSPHSRIPNACVSCHMAGEHLTDAEGNILHVGGHSFNMNDAEGNDHVEACEPCHGEVGESFKEKKFYFMNNADHDGDGVEEGLQEEVHGLLEELATFLPKNDEGNVDMSDETQPPKIFRAGYVYMWVEEDRSFGIHNPAFTVGLLKAAIESLKYDDTMAGQIMSITDIPMDQGFQVRIVWTKFAPDANLATDKIDSYVILREVNDPAPGNIKGYSSINEIPADITSGTRFLLAEATWDIVAVVPAMKFMEYSTVVPTLHNDVETMFKVLGKTENGVVAETEPMGGTSTDDLAPSRPGNLTAAVSGTGIELNWDEALDVDFKYFSIYRSETQGFTPSESDLLISVTKNDFWDNSVSKETQYYYVVSAVDFSGNESDPSNEVAAILTDVAMEGGIPTEFALDQNYPNPFNPSTSIKFALPEISNVKIGVFDITGREVALLVNEQMNAGYYSINWNASNLASGIYFYKLETDNFVNVKKMILLK